MQICIERIGGNAILMHFQASVPPDLRSSREQENILTTKTRDEFSAVCNYG